MRKFIISTLLAGAAFAAQPAAAAVLIEANHVVVNKVKAFSDATHLADGVSVFGKTTIGSELVKYTGNTTIHVTDGGGYALINDNSGVNELNQLMIEFDSYAYGFKAIEFAVSFVGGEKKEKLFPSYLTVTANFLGGASETFTYDPDTLAFLEFSSDANRSFVLTADTGETLKSIVLSSGDDRFNKLKQTDIELAPPPPPPPVVPEPATWAMMLAGFGTVGYAMRRRRDVGVSFA